MPPQNDHAQRLAEIEKKLDAVYASVEKTRQYLFWTLIITIVVVVLPAVGLVFAIPSFISTYTTTMESLDLQGF